MPNPSADQFPPRPTQVRDITPQMLQVLVGSTFPAARITRFLDSVSGRAEPRNSGGPSCVVGDHGPLVTPRSRTSESRDRLALEAGQAARNGSVIEPGHGRAVPGCRRLGWAVLREQMAVESLLNALKLSEQP